MYMIAIIVMLALSLRIDRAARNRACRGDGRGAAVWEG